MRIVHFLAGLLLIPLCAAASCTVVDLIRGLHAGTAVLPVPVLWMGGGFVLWVVLYYTVPRPMRTYILAHELTHALWASAMGARVSDLQVGPSSGSVTLSKSNFLIVLAPYFFPLYTMLILLLYYLLGVFWEVERYALLWLGLVGFSWGFHFTFTVVTLLQHQPDIHECGRLFSYAVIYLMNVLGIGLWIVMVSAATLEQMIALMSEHTLEALHTTQNVAVFLMQRARLQ